MESQRFLNTRQLANFLNISIFFVYKLASEKKIPFIKLGKKLLFDVNKIEAWLENEHAIEPVDWNERVSELLK